MADPKKTTQVAKKAVATRKVAMQRQQFTKTRAKRKPPTKKPTRY